MIDVTRYSIQIKHVEIEGMDFYQAKVKEFPYLDEYADCAESAYRLALDSIETSIEALKKENKTIPLPCNEVEIENYSGRVTLRIPRTLHASLSEIANYEGISLNQLIVAALSEFNGFNHSYYNEPIDHAVHKHQNRSTPKVFVKPLPIEDTVDKGWTNWAVTA